MYQSARYQSQITAFFTKNVGHIFFPCGLPLQPEPPEISQTPSGKLVASQMSLVTTDNLVTTSANPDYHIMYYYSLSLCCYVYIQRTNLKVHIFLSFKKKKTVFGISC